MNFSALSKRPRPALPSRVHGTETESAGARRRVARRRADSRMGAAVVEFAFVAPVLVILVLGSIDVGQSISVSQVVNDASRAGAREASRDRATDTAQVNAAVVSYLQQNFPNISSETLASHTNITVADSAGGPVNGDMSAMQTGDAVSVTVTLQYESVRWTAGFPGLANSAFTTTTVMRRE